MDLSRITIKPRVRNPNESIDLGLIMAKAWWKPLFLSWFIPASIVYFILSLIFYENNWFALLLTWWFKPLWDRAPLYIASRKLFNDDVDVKEMIKALPKLYSFDMFAWLLWRRFSFTRSFDMPVTVLESQKGKQRRKRLDILHRDSSGSAGWLTTVSVHLEMIIAFGVISFFLLLIPNEADINLVDFIIDEDAIATLGINIATFLSMSIIAPFYTMAGFSLYINRRVKLEAWDIEIKFRHLAEKKSKANRLATLSFVFVSFFSILVMPSDTYAATSESLTQEQSKIMIEDVLKGDDFHKKKKINGWRLKSFKKKEEDSEVPKWLISFVEFLESLFSGSEEKKKDFTIAKTLEVILWLVVTFALVYLIYRILKYLDVISPNKRKDDSDNVVVPDVLFGLDIRKDSIPKNVQKETLLLWNRGLHREAIGLLYRSTLSLLVHDFLFEFFYGYTEQECSNIVQKSDRTALKKFVAQITLVWQQVAYAHIIPPEQDVVSLCEQWEEVSKDEK